MNIFYKKRSGSVSIFLAMILLFTLSVVFILAEGIRQLAIKQETKIISHTSRDYLESIYQKNLWDDYGILAVDMSLGRDSDNLSGIEKKLIKSMEKNGNPYIDDGIDFIRAIPSSCSIDDYGLLTDNNGSAFIRLAAQKEFETIPLKTVDELMNLVNKGKTGATADDTMMQDIENGEKALQDIEKEKTKSKEPNGKSELANSSEKTDQEQSKNKYTEKQWGDTEDPMKTAKDQKGKETLSFFLPKGKKVSDKVMSTDNILEKRIIEKGTKEVESPSAINQVMFNEYIMDRMSSYSDEKETTGLKYEVEYILGGSGSDGENLKKIINQILIFRESENVLAIFKDPIKNGDAGSLAISIAGASANPILIEAVKTGIIAGWAYAESVLDVRAIMDGKKVPLIKTQTEWTSELTSLPTLLRDGAQAKSVESGLSYESYIRFLMYFKAEKTAAYRTMDIIENSLSQLEGMENIRMDRLLYSARIRMEYKADTIFPIFTDVPELIKGYAYQRDEEMTYLRKKTG